MQFCSGNKYFAKELEVACPRLKFIEKRGSGSWAGSLYFDTDTLTYFEFGLFSQGHFEISMYKCLSIKEPREWKATAYGHLWKTGDLSPVDKLERVHTLRLIAVRGEGPSIVELYYDPDILAFYEKGPFGENGTPMYRYLDIKAHSEWQKKTSDRIFTVGTSYPVADLQRDCPSLRLITTRGEGPSTIELHYDPDTQTFFEKGPFGDDGKTGFRCLDIKEHSDWNTMP